MPDAIEAELVDLIRSVVNNYTVPITAETTADTVPGWDSVNHINIIVGAEVAFGVKFRTAELEHLHNVGEFVRLIERKRNR